MSADQLAMLLRNAALPRSGLKKIAISTLEGYELVQATDIIRCESDSNYTTIYLKGNTKIVASKTLKDIEELLEEHSFFRVHHSHLVNLNEINKYVKGDGGYLVMSDQSTVNVARSRKDALLNFFAA
ncbi:hypothetical protein GCM10023189_52060 [Nibrella saemangeumensis]|uniref:HTH LytTR-type domain-containing protein n=1 Tax=Nibrella saemangeumensis TaxID=1084526 RepID=A0ABP8NI87_9BACT